MINLGKLLIPLKIDYKEEEGTITFQIPEIGMEGYVSNIQCFLQINFSDDTVFIDYYCENDHYLSNMLSLPDMEVAYGDLEKESFKDIQIRALKVLCAHLEDSQQELIDYIGELSELNTFD